METNTRPEQFEFIPQGGEIQNGDTGNHQDIPPTRRVGHFDRLQGRLLPHPNTGTVQEILEISCPGPDLPVQSTSFRLSTAPMEFTVIAKEALSRTYSGPSNSVPEIGVAGEHGKVRTGTEASFQFRRLSVRPQVRSGPTHTGPVAKPSGKNTESSIPAGLSGPGVQVPDRSVNRHKSKFT